MNGTLNNSDEKKKPVKEKKKKSEKKKKEHTHTHTHTETHRQTHVKPRETILSATYEQNCNVLYTDKETINEKIRGKGNMENYYEENLDNY